jgi:hypothetical protein
LQALVTNKIVSLGAEERSLLEQSYPGTDFSRCLIIQEGRQPAGPVKVVLMVGGGGLLGVAGLVVIGFGFVRWRKKQAQGPRRRDDRAEEHRPRKRRRLIREEDDN